MTDTQNNAEWRKKITDILEAPMRSRYSTSDIRIPMMSSTALSEKVADLEALIARTLNQQLEALALEASTQKRTIKIGENDFAMKQLDMSMHEIKLHNAYAEGWNDANKEATERIASLIRSKKSNGV